MANSVEAREATLKTLGFSRVNEGEHLDAWTIFWGADIELEEQPIWKQWLDALKPHRRNIALTDAAAAVGILGDPDFPDRASCTFLSTPWTSTLSRTKGRILVTEDYKRLESQALDYSRTTDCSNVVIAGQSGSGRTYLSYYILAHALSRRQNMVFFTGKSAVVFSPLGVFSSDRLDLDSVTLDDFNDAIDGHALALVDVAKDNYEFGPPSTLFFSIRVYPPSSRWYEQWIERYRPATTVLDALPALRILSAAALHVDIAATRTSLQQLLTCIRIAGLNLRFCLSLDPSTLRGDLRDYIASLSTVRLSEMAARARFSPHSTEIARQDDGPDIFLLRREIITFEACLPTIASRHILSEIGSFHGFPGLSALEDMEVVKRCPDGFSESKQWLFEHRCHMLLMSGTSDNPSRFTLSQCFPPGAPRRKGALKAAHICPSRNLNAFNPRTSSSFDTDVYHYIDILVDGTLHAIVHARPDVRSSRKITPASDSTLREQRRKLRPRDGDRASRAVGPTRRSRLTAARRFLIFLQIVFGSSPQFTDDGMERIDRIIQSDADAEYFFVFITAPDYVLDLSVIPLPWLNRVKWYQLSVTMAAEGDHIA
ncbi:unnamed protein product [Peniophora sp. CBMAI 1063]|nr:unnamed protein product [Peniophora sp. CBMAI 1063]